MTEKIYFIFTHEGWGEGSTNEPYFFDSKEDARSYLKLKKSEIVKNSLNDHETWFDGEIYYIIIKLIKCPLSEIKL